MKSSKKTQEIELRLGLAHDDPRENNLGFQKALGTFSSTLYSPGIPYSKLEMAFGRASVASYPLAEFIITDLEPAAIRIIGAAAVAWIAGPARDARCA